MTADISVREFEALLIQVSGTAARSQQREMRFMEAERWEQVTAQEFSILRRVDPRALTDSEWRDYLADLDE